MFMCVYVYICVCTYRLLYVFMHMPIYRVNIYLLYSHYECNAHISHTYNIPVYVPHGSDDWAHVTLPALCPRDKDDTHQYHISLCPVKNILINNC